MSSDCGRVFSQMQVWDTAGQERFRTITQSYYRSAHGAMITYDITRRATFDSVSRWIHEVQQFGATNVLMALIGKTTAYEATEDTKFSLNETQVVSPKIY